MPKVLFVCMGNICRSPAAEGIFKKLVSDVQLENNFIIDSAGTIDYHAGELPDIRMRNHALQRGYVLDSRARQFNPEKDFNEFDYIITMDNENYKDIIRLDTDKLYRSKIFNMADFCSDKNVKEVPDPYNGGNDGFEKVLDILEDSTKHLLVKIRADIDRLD
jgi:protein-tyrosine phosphatase